jgi:ribosomal protein L21
MYAVVRVGGKQERVHPGDVIEVEYMKKADPGASIELEAILVVDDDGKPHAGKSLTRAKVTGRLLGEKKGDKIKVFKYRPKSGYARTQGHRQLMSELEIEQIALGDKVARKPAEEPAEKPAPAKKAAAKKTAAKKTAAKKTTAKKPAAKKPTSKKTTAKKTTAKKTTARKKA